MDFKFSSKNLILIIIFLLLTNNGYASDKCIQIYYDRLPNDNSYKEGRDYALIVQNLIGHFQNIQQYIIPINSYHKSDLEKCFASIYIGSNYKNVDNIPHDFYTDFLSTQRNVMWLKFGIWKYTSAELSHLWGVQFRRIEDIDLNNRDGQGRPGYYNSFSYKGESFDGHGEFDQQDPKAFLISSELVALDPVTPQAQKFIISSAHFSTSKKTIPYILRNKNHWYVADTPFSFFLDGDKSFIFADILFDLLDEKPHFKKKPALVRFEDVSPFPTTAAAIKPMTDLFAKEQIPFAIALIPIYSDPLKHYNAQSYIKMTEGNFIEKLKYAQSKQASFIMHGVTHQYDSTKNPFSGVSGEDFEFWDKEKEQAIKEDSVTYVLNLLESGVSLINQANLPIAAWMTPHYWASDLDNILFGQLFSWSVSNVKYNLIKKCNFKPLPEALTLDKAGVNEQTHLARLATLSSLKVVNIPNAPLLKTLIPYEIYGDYYDQRLIPETLGYLSPARTVDDMLKDAKRYRVLRDVWASFFIHAIVLNTTDNHGLAKVKGDTSELERLINGIKSFGYQFIDLQSWTQSHQLPKRPDPIEVDPFPVDCSQ